MTLLRLRLLAVGCLCLSGQNPPGELNINLPGPPELRVDILLRALERHAARLSPQEEALALRDAFDEAARASQTLKRRGLPGSNVESRTNYLVAALENDIDTLSLRARILRRLKPDLAIKMLEASVPPMITPLSCQQAWTWDVESYYQALTILANGGFSKREIAAGRRLEFLSVYALNLTSASQIAPAAALIREVKLEDAEWQSTMALFVSRLTALRDGPRAVSIGVVPTGFNHILHLFDYCRSRHAFAIQVISAYRAFLAANASSVCEDMLAKPSEMPPFARQFNSFIGENPGLGIRPLEFEEVKAGSIDAKAQPELFEVRANDGALFRQVRALRVKGSDLNGDEWKARFRELVDEAQSSFDKGSMERSDIFHEQCALLMALRSMSRDSNEQSLCDQALQRILENSPVEESSPPEWLLHVLEFVKAQGVTNLVASKNAMLSAYALLATHS